MRRACASISRKPGGRPTARTLPRPSFEKDLTELRATPDLPAYLLGDGARLLVGLTDDGRIVGDGVLPRGTERVSYISGMYVRPTTQRRGLGSRMLEAAIAELPAPKPVVLFAQKHRSGVVAFYEWHGFEPVREFTDDFLGTPMPVFEMRRDGAINR